MKNLMPLIGSLLIALSTPATGADPTPLKVGFVYVSPITDAGWTLQHELGRRHLQATLGAQVITQAVDKVAEGPDAERVIRDLASQGNRLIFATSFGYMDAVAKVARDFPQVHFEHAGGYLSAANLATYNARHYEGRYLAGQLAGAVSRSKTLGYVAALPIPEVIRGINAFALGAQSVNPAVRIKVVWTDSWFDPGREKAATDTLIDDGADVLTHHTDSSAVPRQAEARGAWVVGYHSDMSAAAPTRLLASVTHQWGQYYVRRARAVIDGDWIARPTWAGVDAGFVKVMPGTAAALTPALLRTLADTEAALRAGTRHPFGGPVLDREGRLRLPAGRRADDDWLQAMDWFVAGVSAPGATP